MKDADIRTVLQELSKKGGLNLVADEKVKGKVTVQLKNIPAEEALSLIIEGKGYTYKKIGNSYLVLPKEEGEKIETTEIITLKQAEVKEVKKIVEELVKGGKVMIDNRTNSLVLKGSPKIIQSLIPVISSLDVPLPSGVTGGLKTEVFHLQYADANKVKTILTGMGIGKDEGTTIQIYETTIGGTTTTTTGKTTYGATSTGNVAYTAKGNALIIKEYDYNLIKAREVIERLDKPPKQVMIEVRIEEVNKKTLKDLGFKFPDSTSTTFSENPTSGSGKIPFRSFQRTSLNILATINTLQQKGAAKTLASPRLTTIDGRPASIFLGKKIPYYPKVISTPFYGTTGTLTGGTQPFYGTTGTLTGGTQQTGVSTGGQAGVISGPLFADAGITLNITPNIYEEGYVTTSININVSNLVEMINDVPVTEQRTTNTIVRLKDGETLVIGGLISSEDINKLSKFPILADAPILGNLFKSRKKEHRETELIIFITPYIVEP
jgi:type II secretory pathway component GspD/PulD (secretin)